MKSIPPVAKKISTKLEKHNDVRIDDYYWLNDRENPEVISYLEKENTYYEEMTAHTNTLQQQLFEEMKGRIKEDDASVPYFLNGYWYYVRFEEGKGYPIYCRKKETLEASEIILFDINKMAEAYEYYKISGISISPDNKKAIFGVDTVGRRQYELYIKNLETNEVENLGIKNTTGGVAWANDNKTFFYTQKNEVTLRSDKIYKHTLGKEAATTQLVYHETDDTFNTFVYKSKSRAYIIIGAGSTMSDEYRFLDANTPAAEFTLFQERKRGVEYGISHYDKHFYIVTNKDGATNFKLMKTPVENTSAENWQDVLPHNDEVLLEDIDIFKEYLVVTERYQGLSRIRIMRWDETEDYYLPLSGETYTVHTSNNPDFDTSILRYAYNALNTPASVFDFDMKSKTQRLKKQQQVLDANFAPENYETERLWAIAEDGVKIPISLIYKKGIKRDGNNPLLQYAYGSYGHTTEPSFSSTRLSLLDRGFVYAIAHVRGGEYLGRKWYETGKMLSKKNTFTDFISVSKYLIAQQYTSPKLLCAYGGSAGGLLIGAVANLAPDLYKGMIAAVPFVDVVTTMLDDSIPLTTGEYDEWGNPNDKEYYHYIKSYSPYDNVKKQNYPNILVTTGFHDSQVQYWEPAKWVAKLRDYKIDNNKVLFQINMNAGHSGASGRFEALKELAQDYAFLLDLTEKNQ
ncbi:oligopeptidase B [Mesonia hippocampi]|uniref:Proline-specific endopeptidase n=1 Tax=Mesonia hippocampi TaxID=1628250 RepID=A0A840F050_9FLAO|nr:S9 family peptidase [Mesonia hippocampi]MBB4119654.1 oligopeptidase B [Mesonia hippocampi]